MTDVRKYIAGKSVLFIAPKFFGYEVEIAEAMREAGATVDFIPDRPFNSNILKSILRLRREWIVPFSQGFFLDHIRKFGRTHYDFIFVVVGEGLSRKGLEKIKALHPKATFILYMWDSLKNRRKLDLNIAMFDKLLSFDQPDCTVYEMIYRPLFFSKKFISNEKNRIVYDLSFAGTAHSDRYKIIADIGKTLAPNIRFFRFLYLQAKWVYVLYKLSNRNFGGAKIRDFSFTPLPKTEVAQIFNQSFAVLDIEHPRQNGFTMRTFEALGAGKKMLTTNRNIISADFYLADNIAFIDRKNPVNTIPESFFTTPYQPLPDHILKKYALNGWLVDIFKPKGSNTES
jgi:hypothetical protein